ncbi:DUF2946 domain-containing protein [Massilia dura]|uniref:DUF2946 domain-containing protein n=1 Tax=Pseudoduganella dura TaxID=321982 RepID=A0A6I3XHD5_9BURK|nr:DUF2946 domain-containing protein [Pseudoduganella dura]MUI14956.1 DUF2946 domain-containing protein [Pseudoduganella dura]GGY01298.1 hypothetical protein GCM10007386_35360 [Pseudoduganella dura]
MFKTRHWRTCFTWLAFAAILAAALMPSVSRALASDRVANMMMAEICAPSGMSYADMQAPPGDQHFGHMDDCAYCRLQADTPVLPAVIAMIEPGRIAAVRPPLFYLSPAPLFAWTAARPRGPPLLA